MHAKLIREVVKKIESFPPLPEVMMKLLKMVEDEKYSVRDISDVIAGDPALASKVLKVANSSFYGFSGQIRTVSHGTVILGVQGVKNLALGLSVVEMPTNLENTSVTKRDFWRHSMVTGIISKSMATLCKYNCPEEAFVAGLLHDIGKLILIEYSREIYQKVLNHAEATNLPLHLIEREILEIDHCEVGAELCNIWKLPEKIVTTIRNHCELREEPSTDSPLNFIVHASNEIAKISGEGVSGDTNVDIRFLSWTQKYKLDSLDLLKVMTTVAPELAQIEGALGLSQDQASSSTEVPSPQEKKVVFLNIHDPQITKFLSFILVSLNLKPRLISEPKDSEEFSLVISDTDLPPSWKTDTKTYPILDFSKWRKENQPEGEFYFPVKKLKSSIESKIKA